MGEQYVVFAYESNDTNLFAMASRATHEDRERFLSLLRELRRGAGMRQADLARLLGEPQSFVSRFESGERRLDVLELRWICSVLGVGLGDFIKCLEEELA